MKKIMLFGIGSIAAIVAIATLGPVLALALSGAVMYMAWKQYKKADTMGIKLFWGAAGAAGLLSALINMPALMGLAAIFVLYLVYKKWNEGKQQVIAKSDDPFVNFEKQWNELTKMNR